MKIAGEKNVYSQSLAESPVYLMLEPTTKCNLHCRMCPHDELKDIGDMDYSLFLNILEQLPALNTIKFQGLGETYLAKDAIRMLEYCTKRGIDVVSITQCLWKGIDIPHLMTLLKHMYISYHAADEETYKRICGGGNWSLLHNNIEEIVKNRGNCEVVLNCVLSELNYWQAEQIVEHASDMHVEHVRFQIMQNWTTKENAHHDDFNMIRNMNEKKVVENLKKAYCRASELGISIELVGNDEFDYTHCIWPFERTYITKNGDVMPCHMRPLPENSVGNIKDAPFYEIWNGNKLNHMRKKLGVNEAPDMCVDCPYLSAAQEIREIRAMLNNYE